MALRLVTTVSQERWGRRSPVSVTLGTTDTAET